MQVFKPHPNVSIRSTVSVNLSASQWQLKTHEWPRIIVERVADFLNKSITQEYNKGESLDIVKSRFGTLKKSFGLYITPETDRVFNDIVRVLYNE